MIALRVTMLTPPRRAAALLDELYLRLPAPLRACLRYRLPAFSVLLVTLCTAVAWTL